jgi:hypothetical protein
VDIIFAGQYCASLKRIKIAQNFLLTCQNNEKVIDFGKMFVNKILKAEGEVSFEDRLVLENAVRDINSQLVFDQWQKFVNAGNETVAQIELKNLLELLVNKINY